MQLIKKAGRNHAIEKRHFIGALIESVLDEEFDGFLHKGHVIIEIRERDFRFDHPELACVAGGIRFFGAEGLGLGFDFLKHISRTACLLFMIEQSYL